MPESRKYNKIILFTDSGSIRSRKSEMTGNKDSGDSWQRVKQILTSMVPNSDWGSNNSARSIRTQTAGLLQLNVGAMHMYKLTHFDTPTAEQKWNIQMKIEGYQALLNSSLLNLRVEEFQLESHHQLLRTGVGNPRHDTRLSYISHWDV